jgi:putative heme-binding domain-containing protein
MNYITLILAVVLLFGSSGERCGGAEKVPASRFQVAPELVVEQVAGPELVKYPLFACFDEKGRLYVAEGTGTNLPGEELVKKKLGRILLLEDTNGDGTFDKSQVFAQGLVFPQGVLWHDGALFVTSHPSLWRLADTDGDGRADRQDELVTGFKFNGNGCDIHGPFLGPDGLLYWTDGRHGYQVKTREGATLEGLASRVWRCRTDGSQIERLCGGGFDNPVELEFTAAGDLIGTMDQGTGDALLHYVEGGVYPMPHACVAEFPLTGPLLGAINQYSAALPVALCGLVRYRSASLGEEYRDSLFTAQFNVHRVEQHRLVRAGSTYRAENKDFVTSVDYDVHLSDILEDADGSLLFVDMGAWFNFGCPTSKIAKPQVLGAIYRIRRPGAATPADPWGKSLKLETRSAAELVALVDDPRPKVRDQVVARLAALGGESVAALAEIIRPQLGEQPRTAQARLDAAWALCRIGTREAQAALRGVLADEDLTVRQVAVHAAGLYGDRDAAAALKTLVVQGEPQLRLKAAESLGRIGQGDAVPALLDSLRQGSIDRHLEHALVYALIRINDRAATIAGLEDSNPRVRQAALVALDQMPDGGLTEDVVVPLLDTDDPDLQQAALECISRRPGWSDRTVELMRQWLSSDTLTTAQQQSLSGALLAFSQSANVQSLATEALESPGTAVPTRLLLLRVLARSRLAPLPEAWRAALGQALGHDDLSIRREAVFALKALALAHYDEQLAALSRQRELPADLRIAALDCLAPRHPQLDADAFALLLAHVDDDTEPLLRVAAGRTLGASALDREQLMKLAGRAAGAGPMVLPLLMPSFAKSTDSQVGTALVDALTKSPGTDSLSVEDLDGLLKDYPGDVQALAGPLRDRLAARHGDQAAYLAQLMLALLPLPANAEHGREVFFSKKAACYSCHTAAGKGGLIGPDLSQVGRFRTTKDLLEAIVYPSSTIVPHFRSYVLTTADGQVIQGMIVRHTADSINLRTPGQLGEVHVATNNIDAMSPSNVSLMPDGLEKTITRQELKDLLEFLYQQR